MEFWFIYIHIYIYIYIYIFRVKSYIKRYIFRHRNKYIPVHCVNISHIDVVLLFRGERETVRTIQCPITYLVSRSLFLLFCIRDRENGFARVVFIAEKLCRSCISCRRCKLSDGNARAHVFFEGYPTARFDFSEKRILSDVSVVCPALFLRFLPPFGPYVSDLPLSLYYIIAK